MSLEIAQPFTLDLSGGIANVSDPNLQVSQHVNSLISTIQGERVMLPAYGLNLSGLVFGNNDPVLIQVMQNDVNKAFSKWEPNISITSINPSATTDPMFGVAAIDVTYMAGSNKVSTLQGTQYKTVTITQGGTVVNQ
jgi:phage baseplate assembly protein W